MTEPFGYFKAEPFGWTDCAETDEGAVALYAAPPAQEIVCSTGLCRFKETQQPAQQEPVANVWEMFAAYLIDKCEGEIISEEGLQRSLADMLADPNYAAPQPAQQQEPIYQIKGFDTGNAWHDASHDAYDMTLSRDRRIVYASPQPAQQEPVGEWGDGRSDAKRILWKPGYVVAAKVGDKLYTSPPASRTWVGLAHDEYDAICDKHSAMSDFDFLADIDAKLREKNK